MARAKRTTMRLEGDVRKFLEESKQTYDGMDMTSIMQFCVRYVRDEDVLEDYLRKTTDEKPPMPPENKETFAGNNNQTATKDREMGPSNGVSFSDISRMEEEEEPGENDSTRGPDESGGNEDGSSSKSPEDDGKRKSAASSFRERFRT